MFFSQGVPRKGRKSHAFTPGSFSCLQPRDRYCPRGRRFWRSGSSGKDSAYFSGPCKKLPGSSWAVESDCDLSDGSQSPSSLRFTPGGTVINYTPGPGTGTWSMISSNQFQYQFEEQIFDSQGNQIGYVDVQQATLSADGTIYTASGQGTVHAMDGTI